MMRICFSIVLLLAASHSAVGGEAPPASLKEGHGFLTTPGDAWKLRWNDEFNGDALDRKKWDIGLPWGGSDGEGRHHNDLYASYIMDHNVMVEDGKLKLLTRREDVTDKKGRTFHFTQGLVTTSKHFRQRFGYWEVRVKLPVEAGPGLWPAFWTLAEGWPPEMDICEVWTSHNRSHQGMCYRPAGGGRERWDDVDRTDVPLPLDWTTYGMEWGPGYQVYNVNGRVTKRVYGEHVTQDAHYVLLNSGVDAQRPPTAATVFPNAFQVEYLRVYERPEIATLHNGGFENEDGQRPWGRSGQVVHVRYGAHGGEHALRVDGGPSTSEQKIFGLKPKTAYVLSGWVKKLSDDVEARLGVKDHGGEETFAKAERKEYQELTVEFTTGATATTATVYCFVPGSAGAALFDDIELREKR